MQELEVGTRFMQKNQYVMRCVTSPEVCVREMGLQGDFSDDFMFVPHSLGDTGLRKIKDEILPAADRNKEV